MHEDTISAIATAVGDGGIGIVRLSGNLSLKIAEKIFLASNHQQINEIASHRAVYGHIIDPKDNAVIDEVILIAMHAPHSYTREDVVEIQCHGGVVALRSILELTLHSGARLAEPGEFTKRAFLNGRLDLMQAQAVIDIIRAKTDASLRMAVGHLEGFFSDKINGYRHSILELIAHLEAAIDFPEDDIDELATDEVREKILIIKEDLESLLATAKKGRVLREGLETVIVGKPNVGKSSLLNMLLNEERAIVTDIPGTTRDSIEEYANVGGIPLKIIDTAGIRETDDAVEKIGVRKAHDYIERADLVLVMIDASRPLGEEDKSILSLAQHRPSIVLLNKSDLTNCIGKNDLSGFDQECICLSTRTGQGMDELEKAIANMVFQGNAVQKEGAFVNNVRQEEILRHALQYIGEVLHTVDLGMSPDFIVIDLRAAWEKLGELTGDTVGEDIITEIFSKFCIGK